MYLVDRHISYAFSENCQHWPWDSNR